MTGKGFLEWKLLQQFKRTYKIFIFSAYICTPSQERDHDVLNGLNEQLK